MSLRLLSRRGLSSRQGFTLIEVMVATALLGFSLIVMFGFHAQAVRSNMQARKITDCTYLAQSQMEQLLSLEWTQNGTIPGDLAPGNSGAADWAPLYHPAAGAFPTAVNSIGEYEGSEGEFMPRATYYITWETDSMNSTAASWLRIRVRCSYQDAQFGTWTGQTISSYRYVDG